MIATALGRLFTLAGRVSARTTRAVLNQSAGRIAVNAAARLGARELTQVERVIIEEATTYVTNYAISYIDHHNDRADPRFAQDLHAALEAHANAIVAQLEQSLQARARGHALIMIAPTLADKRVLTNLVLAVIAEVEAIKTQHV